VIALMTEKMSLVSAGIHLDLPLVVVSGMCSVNCAGVSMWT
jgi:hypothetical protein